MGRFKDALPKTFFLNEEKEQDDYHKTVMSKLGILGQSMAPVDSEGPKPRKSFEVSNVHHGSYMRVVAGLRKFVLDSADNLGALLIFIYASQGKTWSDLHTYFPVLIEYYKRVGYVPIDKSWWGSAEQSGRPKMFHPDFGFDYISTKGEQRKTIPFQVLRRFAAKRGAATFRSCNYAWEKRTEIHARIAPLIKAYDRESSSKRPSHSKLTDIAFDIFAQYCSLPGLGLPKAGFACQLTIGEFGCIDSINTSVYLDNEKSQKDATEKYNKLFPKPGEMASAVDFSAGSKKVKSFQYSDLQPASAERMKQYVAFINSLKRSSQDRIDQQLWEDWVAIVAAKIMIPKEFNRTVALDVQIPIKGGKTKTLSMNSYSWGEITKTVSQNTILDLEKMASELNDLNKDNIMAIADAISLDHGALPMILGDDGAVNYDEIMKRIERQKPGIKKIKEQESEGPKKHMMIDAPENEEDVNESISSGWFQKISSEYPSGADNTKLLIQELIKRALECKLTKK